MLCVFLKAKSFDRNIDDSTCRKLWYSKLFSLLNNSEKFSNKKIIGINSLQLVMLLNYHNNV